MAFIDNSQAIERVAQLAAQHSHRPGALLPLLHAVSHEFGYIDDDAVPVIASALNISRAEVHGVMGHVEAC